MRKKYGTPYCRVIDVGISDIICYSYGSIPVGGRTDSFDDNYSGSISTGGTTDGFDAASRRISDWNDYENQPHK